MLTDNYPHPFSNPTSWRVRPEIFDVDPQLGDPYAHIPKGGGRASEPAAAASTFEGHRIVVTPEFAVLGEPVCFALIETAIARVLTHRGDDIRDPGVPLQMLMERFVRDEGLMNVDVPAALHRRIALWWRVFGCTARYVMQRLARPPRLFERKSL